MPISGAMWPALIVLLQIAPGAAESGYARVSAGGPNEVDAAGRAELIAGICSRLHQTYVFPETAARMESALHRFEKRGAYAGVSDPFALAESLTVHLRAVSHDTHLEVHYSPTALSAMDEAPHQKTPEEREQRRRDLAWVNDGFVEAKRLPGNVGFLDLDSFCDPALGGATAAAAMQFLANCDALIIDLRYNSGGHAGMATLLASYLFDGEPVHFMDIYSRPEDFTLQTWTAEYVPGPRFLSKEVYLLTSERTHSAAEHFAYGLQAAKRATVVGAVTRGGAHPTGRYRISEHFALAVPEARAISPVTGTDWEGTGVRPDVAVPADSALVTAQRLALESLLRQNRTPDREADLRHASARLSALRPEPGEGELAGGSTAQRSMQAPPEVLDACTGTFQSEMGLLTVTRVGGQLRVKPAQDEPVLLTPESGTTFLADDVGARLTYLRSPGGDFDTLRVEMGGRAMTGTRVR